MIRLLSFVALSAALSGCGGGGGGSGGGGAGITSSINGATVISRGQLATFTADTNASINADFVWTVTDIPAGSRPVADVDNDQIVIASSQGGSYVVQLVVIDNGVSSAPVVLPFEIVDNGPQPARDMIQAEINQEAEFLLEVDILPRLRSPSSFMQIGESTFARNGDSGAVRIEFDSQNGFGAVLRSTAVCPFEWNSVMWFSQLDEQTLTLCFFL